MGMQKREGNGGGTALFFKLNAKEGCVQYTVPKVDGEGQPVIENGKAANTKIKERPGDVTLTGTLVGAEIKKDEFQGAVNYALRLKLVDPTPGEPNMYIDLPFGSEANGASMFGLQVMGKLNAADLNKPVSLTPWFLPAGHVGKGENKTPTARDMSGCTLMQDGVKITEDYGNGQSRLPELPKVMVGNKEVTNKEPWDNLAQEMFAALEARLVPSPQEAAHEEEGIDPSEVAGAAPAPAAPAARPSFAPRG